MLTRFLPSEMWTLGQIMRMRPSKPLANCASSAWPTLMVKAIIVLPYKPDLVEHLELSAPDVTVDPFQIGAFPKLEESIPPHYLPKLLCIHDPDGRVSGTEPTGNTIYYRRMFPEHHPDDSENGSPDSPRIAHLYLTRESRVGCGHHSNVYRASFHLPPPLDTESQGHVAVVAKVAVPRCEAREFLHHEAATYNTFPDHLAQEYCGYALVPGLKYPVPVGAVVPKFFGYYVPEQTGYDASNTAEPSPILLLEECGSPVDPQNLSHDNK
ncbi:hypothetical protein DFH09DRAFT_1146909 [Mycena vulgaris]|nr:hypothetical protein DFH09DRAFT_1146909 [Mycena vulgaris]